MSTLKYRLVTNWPASMNEDFTFESTEDRNAHYNLCVEILSCIADERHPEDFRLTDETIYEYDVERPQEPSLPRMPLPTEGLETDEAFLELCRRYSFTDKVKFARNANTKSVHVSVTESFTLEGEDLARMAILAKMNPAEAKFHFVLAVYGVEDDEVTLLNTSVPDDDPFRSRARVPEYDRGEGRVSQALRKRDDDELNDSKDKSGKAKKNKTKEGASSKKGKKAKKAREKDAVEKGKSERDDKPKNKKGASKKKKDAAKKDKPKKDKKSKKDKRDKKGEPKKDGKSRKDQSKKSVEADKAFRKKHGKKDKPKKRK